MSLLEIARLSKIYPGTSGGAVVVQGFDLTVEAGEIVSLVGHSGCGKSTVLTMVAGLNTPTSGTILLAGKEVIGPDLDRGVVFQAPCLLPWLSALENVRLGIDSAWPDRSLLDRTRMARKQLGLVGLTDELDKKPAELSGGMRQRVGIARALALEPRILLLDEPFGMLDSLTRWEIEESLCELCEQTNTTAMLVTHDVDEALFLSDRIVLMTCGPAAQVGDIVPVPFPRPRRKSAVLEHPEYYALREHILGFLQREGERVTSRSVIQVA